MHRYQWIGRLALVLSLALVVTAEEELARQPSLIPPPAVIGLGRPVTDLSLPLLDAEERHLDGLLGEQGAILVARSVACPLCRKWAPAVARLEAQAAAMGFTVLHLQVGDADDHEAIRADRRRHGFTASAVVDPERRLARLVALQSTTEVVLLDSQRRIRYRGSLSDQYGLGYAKPQPVRHYLHDAMVAVAAGRDPLVVGTVAPGCSLALEPLPADPVAGVPVWAGHVDGIIQRHCLRCHHEGGPGPFSFATAEQVVGHRAMVADVVEDGLMPPWYAAGGDWLNDASMPEQDRRDLIAWIDAGCPLGDPDRVQRLQPPTADAWQIGEPDLVIEAPESFTVPAEGVVDYQYHWARNPEQRDRWVQAMEIRVDQPAVVHHVLVFLEEPRRRGESEEDYKRRFDGGLTGFFAPLAPGTRATVYPPGMARKLPRRSWLKFQTHYTPNGSPVVDRVRIGFRFTEGPPEHEVHTASVANREFVIPPHAADHRVRAATVLPEDRVVLSFLPHLHVRGTAFRYVVFPPGIARDERLLLDIPRYDFNWQLRYDCAEPVALAAGSVLTAEARFDNSAANPANPDPDAEVSFGLQTFDEMLIGYYEYYRP